MEKDNFLKLAELTALGVFQCTKLQRHRKVLERTFANGEVTPDKNNFSQKL